MDSISFESPNIREIDFWLVKNVAALLRHFIVIQSYPIYVVEVHLNNTALYQASLQQNF